MSDNTEKGDPPAEPVSEHPNGPAQASGPPNAVWPGMTLGWDSQLVPIQLHVELPFWLFMPDGDLDVSIEGCILRVTVTQNAVEIQRGPLFRPSHANVILVEKLPLSEKAQEVVKAEKGGVTFRSTRTFTDSAHQGTGRLNQCVARRR